MYNASLMSTRSAAPAWFRRHFNEDYRILYRGRDEAQAEREAGFAAAVLDLHPGMRVLDLCCGFGRHLAALAKRGIRASGVDLSPTLLRQAVRVPGVLLACADMRRLPFPGGDRGFHAVLNFFTSFGYFESDEENAEAAREMARVLRPGGGFLLDLMNPRAVLETLEPRSEKRAGPFRIEESRRYDERRRRIEKEIRLFDHERGEIRTYFESVRLYSPEEIEELLRDAGLRPACFYGDFDGRPLSAESPRLIVVGERRR